MPEETSSSGPAAAGQGQLRIGIVGLASLYWPVALAKNLAKLPQARLLAAADLGESAEQIRATLGCTGEEFASQFGVRVYRQIDEMIRAERLDTVAICSRHSLHAQHVEQAAACGADIYLCKTMATTSDDCGRIVQAGRRHGVRIAVGPGGRFQPQHVLARRLVDDARIGRPIAVRISHNHGTLDVFAPADWYRDAEEGGPELSLGWYVVDVLRGILPQPVRRVYAEYGNFATPLSPFMDQGKVVLRFADGAIGSCDLYFSNRFRFPTWDLEVIGTEGAIRTHAGGDDGLPQALLWTAKGVEQLEVPAGDNWTADTAAWVGAFAAGQNPPIDAAEGQLITEISLACRESARRGQPVAV
jgi:myo-inositol 2-dehydrogenase/D-chiro-inositol 1-dehydrogenase